MSSSSSLSSASSSSDTLSSWSSGSAESSASPSSSSSSWSSETSAWDTGSHQAKSYLVSWDIKAKNNLFYARCQIDLRWRDSVIVEARGPLVIDIAGVFNGEYHTSHAAVRYGAPWRSAVIQGSSSSDSSRPQGRQPYPVQFVDDFAVHEVWHSLAAAQAWVAAIEARLQAAMAVLRQLYKQYPDTFDQRTRTI